MRHFQGANVGFVDGHVKRLKLDMINANDYYLWKADR